MTPAGGVGREGPVPQGRRPSMTRRIVLAGAVALAVVLLGLANVFAVQVFDLMAEEAGGFVVFVNSIGVMTLTSVAVGVLVASRAPSNRIGPMLIGGALLLEAVFVSWPLTVLSYVSGWVPPFVSGVIAWLATVGLLPALFILLPTVGLTFPDGRLPGPRWRVAYAACAGVLAIGGVLVTIAPWSPTEEQSVANPFAVPGLPTTISEVGGAIAAVAVCAGFGLAVAGMIGRFRRGTALERAQLKWLLAALAVGGVVFPLSFATDIGPADLIDVGSVLIVALIPVAIGIAILRYRLFDIDRIISRTLSWAVITGVLVSVFALLVVGLQTALLGVTQGQTLAVAASTLIAFALFQPVRRWIQAAVDRRFDRARYDGERTAAAFADRLRDRVALTGLERDIAGTVREALRPRSVGVWTRPAAHDASAAGTGGGVPSAQAWTRWVADGRAVR
jgi:hypothetical protein